MATALGIGRARSDIDVISRAGVSMDHFMDQATAVLQSVVPYVAACLSTLDPATVIVSSVRKQGELDGHNDSDLAWARIEYGGDDPTATHTMVADGKVALSVSEENGGEVERSMRMAEFLIPRFGFRDEARVVFTDRTGAWGTISMFRGSQDSRFSADEVAFIASVAPSFTRGIRTGLLSQLSRSDAALHAGPAVIIVDAHDRIVQSSPSAEEYLTHLAAAPHTSDPLTIVQALVSRARRVAHGESDVLPRIRSRTWDGIWLVLHAAPLGGSDERPGDVVVTIEPARPQELIELIAAAFGLTVREREVVSILLRGADTKEIAAQMHVSPYTVQDHLKSIFEKAGVTSRRELVARVFLDQYAPRMNSGIGTNGWFTAGGGGM